MHAVDRLGGAAEALISAAAVSDLTINWNASGQYRASDKGDGIRDQAVLACVPIHGHLYPYPSPVPFPVDRSSY